MCMPLDARRRPAKLVDRSGGSPVPSSPVNHQLAPCPGPGTRILGVLIDVAVGVAGDGDGLLPSCDTQGEMPLTMTGARNTVPSSMARMVPLGLFHICLRPYSSTRWALGVMVAHLTRHAVFLGGLGGVHRHLVVGLVPVLQAQVVVFGLQVHIGHQQLVLDLLPEDAGHFVAVHLHQRRFHQNLVQNNPVPFAIVFDRTEGSLAIVAGLYRNSNTRYSKRTARLCGRGVCAIIEVRCRHT